MARRTKRVPYQQAMELVGERVLADRAGSRKLIEHDWKEKGVPAERMCWMLIEAIERGEKRVPRADPAVIEDVRMIAARTEQRGDLWRLVADVVRHAKHSTNSGA